MIIFITNSFEFSKVCLQHVTCINPCGKVIANLVFYNNNNFLKYTNFETTSTSSSSCFALSQLQFLELWNVDDLVSLPEEWLGNLTSLQYLQIGYCPNLTSLPQGIRNLTSLQDLRIWKCPLLGQRCQRQTGEDWPNIAHVPYVRVDGVDQQQETIPSPSCSGTHVSFNPNFS